MSDRTRALGAVVFTVLMVTSMVAGTAAVSATTTQSGNTATAQFDSGSGTADDPYVITDASQLQNMGNDLTASYVLGNDIDASSIANFEPIGDSNNQFTGSLNGSDYTISGITIDRPSTDYVGLIGYMGTSGVVENVGVVDANVTGTQYVGGLAGWNNGGAVSTSYVTGSVTGDSRVGGLVGVNFGSGTVSDSHATAIVTNSSTGTYYGGLVGENKGDISGSYATGSVTGDELTGGLVGSSSGFSSTVSNSYATGDVTGINQVGGLSGSEFGPTSDSYATGNVTGDENVGGLVGFNADTLDNSYATGNITQRDSSLVSAPVGGLVGENGGTVSNSYATGSVTGSARDIGGLAGRNGGTVSNSYATGSVAGPKFVGGLVGYNQRGTIERAYAAGAVTGEEDLGGLVGFDQGDISDAYWDTETTGQAASSGSGSGLTTAELKGSNATSNTNLDFTADWSVVASPAAISYPYLQSNTQEPAPGLESLAPFPGGFGTAADPYQIGNWSHLDSVREYPAAHFTLVNDLNETTADYDEYANETANGGAGWEPIGDAKTPFSGSFDGDGHTVANLTIDRSSEDNVGLFGSVGNAETIGNVTLEHVSIVGNTNLGGLIGDAEASKAIRNVHVTGTVNGTGTDRTGDTNVGGLVGAVDAVDIVDSSATVELVGTANVGGLVGTVDNANISGLAAAGSVTGATSGLGLVENVGGLVGVMTAGNVTDSAASGTVNATGQQVGGLVGVFNRKSVPDTYSITNSSASGNVTGMADIGGNVGGLVGLLRAAVLEGSSASGVVTATNDYAGGLVGQSLASDIANSSASGTVTGEQSVGGLVGRFQGGNVSTPSKGGNVTNTTATGEVNATGRGVGGLIGVVDNGNVSESTASAEVAVNADSDGGTVEDVGGLIGNFNGQDGSNGTLSNSSASGDVTGPQNVGGLVGVSAGTITDSHASGDVVGNGDGSLGPEGRAPKSNYTFGGLVGSATVGTIVNSSATGNVAAGQSVGGLVGKLGSFDSTATVVDSTAAGAVTGSKFVGGLAGSISQGSGSVSNSTALGSVTGTSTVGGLVGLNRDQITGSYAAGTVSGQDAVGGLVGSNSGNASDSYATGAVSGNKFVGGVVGFNSGNVTHAYAGGAVTGTDSIGGLVGAAEVPKSQKTGTTIASYWDTETTGQEKSAGDATGLTTSQLKGDAATTNTALDFTTTWSVLENDTHVSYPYLQANPQRPEPGLEEVVASGPSDGGGSSNSNSDSSSNSGGSSSGSSGSSGTRSVVSVSPGTGTENGQFDDNGQAEDVTDRQAVSVRNVALGERVAIVFESPGGDRPTTEIDQPTIEGNRPTEPPGDTADVGDASQASLRNVIPDGLDITFKQSGDWDLEVSSRDIDVFDRVMDDPGAPVTPDLSMDALDDDSKRFVSATNQRPVGFIEVDTKFDSSEVVEEATHKFRVRKSYLTATGASVDSVRLYRDEADGWRSLPTRQTDEDEAFYYFEADTPGFSVFAIGTSSPVFETGAASLDSFDETTGEFEATVPVENVGDAPGEFEATLTADGAVVATRAVALEANATTELTVTGSLDAPGSATLRLAGQSIGAVTRLGDGASTAEGDADGTPQADGDGAAPVDTDDDDAASGLGALATGISLVLVLGLFLFAAWRRRDEEEDGDPDTTR